MKAGKIILGLLAVGLIAVGIYYTFFQKEEVAEVKNNAEATDFEVKPTDKESLPVLETATIQRGNPTDTRLASTRRFR